MTESHATLNVQSIVVSSLKGVEILLQNSRVFDLSGINEVLKATTLSTDHIFTLR